MKFKEVSQLLNQLDPVLFTPKFIKKPKPLPLRVHVHLLDRYVELFGVSKTKARPIVGKLLHRFTNRPMYWHKIVACPYRVDLQGKRDPANPIAIEHRLYAQIQLDEYHDRKYWKLANEGKLDKIVKHLITKETDIIDLEKVFVATGVQLAHLKEGEHTQEQVNDLLDKQAKRIINKLYKTKGISFYAFLPKDFDFSKLLTEWYAIYKDIYAIQVNGKVYKCKAFYDSQVQFKQEYEAWLKEKDQVSEDKAEPEEIITRDFKDPVDLRYDL